MGRLIQLICVAFLFCIFGGCNQNDSAGEDQSEATGQNQIGSQFRNDKIYINSIPQGATVILQTGDEKKTNEVEIGKTPLVLDPSEVPSMSFIILMNIEDYLKTITPLQQLSDWTERFKMEQRVGLNFGAHQNYFEFDTPDSRVITNASGGLVAVGPVYNLNYPSDHRLVALFIPRGVSSLQFSIHLCLKPGHLS